MITITATTYYEVTGGGCVRQQKTIQLFGWVIFRWEQREAASQPVAKS